MPRNSRSNHCQRSQRALLTLLVIVQLVMLPVVASARCVSPSTSADCCCAPQTEAPADPIVRIESSGCCADEVATPAPMPAGAHWIEALGDDCGCTIVPPALPQPAPQENVERVTTGVGLCPAGRWTSVLEPPDLRSPLATTRSSPRPKRAVRLLYRIYRN